MKTDQKSKTKSSLVHATLKRAVFLLFCQISSKSRKFENFLFAIIFVLDLPLLLKEIRYWYINYPMTEDAIGGIRKNYSVKTTLGASIHRGEREHRKAKVHLEFGYIGEYWNIGKYRYISTLGTLGVWVHWDYGNIRNMGKLGSIGASLWEYWNNESMGIIRTMEILRVGTMYPYSRYSHSCIVLIFGMGILGVWVDLTYIESMGIILNRRKGRFGVLVYWECRYGSKGEYGNIGSKSTLVVKEHWAHGTIGSIVSNFSIFKYFLLKGNIC